MSDPLLDGLGLSADTLARVKLMESNLPTQQTDEFSRLREDLLGVQVCTSLSDEDATVRLNLVPSGTRFGWQLTERPDAQPVPCDDKPETHRHLYFEC